MASSAEEWEKVKSLFDAALELAPEQRKQFLAENCKDENVRGEVLSLLHNHDSAGSFLASPSVPTSDAVTSRQPGRALSIETKLGHYEIQAPIGAGGMGEVYRARDAQLGRDVAIKVLPSFLS